MLFFMILGGGCKFELFISVFWWEGLEIRIEEENTTLSVPKKIYQIFNPEKDHSKQNEIMQLVLEALEAGSNHSNATTNKTVKYLIENDIITEYR